MDPPPNTSIIVWHTAAWYPSQLQICQSLSQPLSLITVSQPQHTYTMYLKSNCFSTPNAMQTGVPKSVVFLQHLAPYGGSRSVAVVSPNMQPLQEPQCGSQKDALYIINALLALTK